MEEYEQLEASTIQKSTFSNSAKPELTENPTSSVKIAYLTVRQMTRTSWGEKVDLRD